MYDNVYCRLYMEKGFEPSLLSLLRRVKMKQIKSIITYS